MESDMSSVSFELSANSFGGVVSVVGSLFKQRTNFRLRTTTVEVRRFRVRSPLSSFPDGTRAGECSACASHTVWRPSKEAKGVIEAKIDSSLSGSASQADVHSQNGSIGQAFTGIFSKGTFYIGIEAANVKGVSGAVLRIKLHPASATSPHRWRMRCHAWRIC